MRRERWLCWGTTPEGERHKSGSVSGIASNSRTTQKPWAQKLSISAQTNSTLSFADQWEPHSTAASHMRSADHGLVWRGTPVPRRRRFLEKASRFMRQVVHQVWYVCRTTLHSIKQILLLSSLCYRICRELSTGNCAQN